MEHSSHTEHSKRMASFKTYDNSKQMGIFSRFLVVSINFANRELGSHLCHALHLHIKTVFEINAGFHDVVNSAGNHSLQQGRKGHLRGGKCLNEWSPRKPRKTFGIKREQEIPPRWARGRTTESQIETEARMQETRDHLRPLRRLESPAAMVRGTLPL